MQEFQLCCGNIDFLKTLLVSAETLKGEQTDGVNTLIMQTGIWLEDQETLYSNDEYL